MSWKILFFHIFFSLFHWINCVANTSYSLCPKVSLFSILIHAHFSFPCLCQWYKCFSIYRGLKFNFSSTYSHLLSLILLLAPCLGLKWHPLLWCICYYQAYVLPISSDKIVNCLGERTLSVLHNSITQGKKQCYLSFSKYVVKEWMKRGHY